MIAPEATGNAQSAVHVDALTFSYPQSSPLLCIQSLDIDVGERIFLHGPSGSGKSTLLSLIAGVLQPLSGVLRVLDHDFHRIGPAARDRVRGTSMGYIFQSLNLIPYLSVGQNIELPCLMHRERLRRIRASTLRHEVLRLAERLDVAALLDRSVDRLSVGQQQRVAIARALIGSPPLLIADEPTSALDPDRRDEFLVLLNELLDESRQRDQPSTLLYVSHDAALAKRFDRHLSLPQINRARTKDGLHGAV